MKKSLKLILIIFLMLIVLAGCSNKSEQKWTIWVWQNVNMHVNFNYANDNSYYKFERDDSQRDDSKIDQSYKNVIVLYYDDDEWIDVRRYNALGTGHANHSALVSTFLANNVYNIVYLVQANNGYTKAIQETTTSILESEKSTFEGIKCNYFVGGISRGNKTAMKMMMKNTDSFDGLLLYAHTLSKKYDLSKTDKKVFCMYGSCDTVLTPKDIEDSKQYYPVNSVFYEISGGTNESMNLKGDIWGEKVLNATDYPIDFCVQMGIMIEETYNYMYANILSMKGDNND